MKKTILTFCLLSLVFTIVAQSEERRLALVIGNSAYTTGGVLKNPVNDANLMASTLQDLGFTVIKMSNANRAQMAAAVAEFWSKLKDYNIALFYYAGHGVQVGGINYLIPVDAQLDNKDMVSFEAISVNDVSSKFEEYDKNINIIILDACRNNPFRSWSRGGDRGFKAINPASGTIIAFATSEGAAADDGTGVNGLFTEQLVKQLKKAEPIENVFKLTRVEVERVSGGKQSPQEWSKLKGNFYFVKPSRNQNDNVVNNNQTIEPTLGNVEELTTYGNLQLTTEIAGDMYLDGKKLGSIKANTKVPVNKIATGSHTLEIRGSENFSQQLTIYKDQISQVNAKTQVVINNQNNNTNNTSDEHANNVVIKEASLTSDVDKNIPENIEKFDKRYALIIGNEDYSSYQKGLANESNVLYAKNDAMAFQQYALKTLGIPERNIIMLLNATAGEMAQKIELATKLVSAVGSDAELVFFYAGHGYPEENTRIPYLIPVDVSVNNINTAIKLSEIYSKFGNSGAKRVTIFLDACFSGGSREAGLLSDRSVIIKPKALTLFGNTIVFAASSGEQSALTYKDKQHGLFTYYLLKKLQESKGILSYSELSDYLISSVGIESVIINSKMQVPEINVSNGIVRVWKSLMVR